MQGITRPNVLEVENLCRFINNSRYLVAITGAGISTASGLPDYRGPNGSYSKGHKPMTHAQFVQSEYWRKRYWARSMVGWPQLSRVKPNAAHLAMANLELWGILKHTVTQNVDRLHQSAGSSCVTDLHGRIDMVKCLICNEVESRLSFQKRLEEQNEEFLDIVGRVSAEQYFRADGDVDLGKIDTSKLCAPGCKFCGGIMKPDFVFFGDNVPLPRVESVYAEIDKANALLVVGTSLEVFSAYRFVLKAANRQIPIAIVNMGETRAERQGLPTIAFKSEFNCAVLLEDVISRIS